MIAPDQAETQVQELVTSLTPPKEPECSFISPDHSAEAKRQTFQSKGNAQGRDQIEETDEPTKGREEKTDPKEGKLKETKVETPEPTFTESDQEARGL